MVKPEPADATQAEVLELATRLVAVDSQNPGSGEAQIAVLLADHCAQRGFDVELAEYAPGRPNLLVTADCGPGPAFGLSGHIDTKPIGRADEWRTDPFVLTLDDGRAFGLGAVDMKSSVAAMVLALERFAATSAVGRAMLVLTADEEQGSEVGAKALARAGKLALDALLVGEPSGVERSWESLYIVSRGICCFTAEITTRQGHSGLSSLLGRNAVQVAGDLLHALEHELDLPVARAPTINCVPTVNPGIAIEGGVTFGTWPGQARLASEIRLVPGMSMEATTAAIRQLVDQVVAPHGSAEVRFAEGSLAWMEGAELSADSPVVAAAQRACERTLGHRLPLGAYPGGTDATYFIGGGIPAIASLGPGRLTPAHGPNEWIDVRDVLTAVDLYTAALHEFAGLPAADER